MQIFANILSRRNPVKSIKRSKSEYEWERNLQPAIKNWIQNDVFSFQQKRFWNKIFTLFYSKDVAFSKVMLPLLSSNYS